MLSLPDFREKQLVICFATDGQKVSFNNDNLLVSDVRGKVVFQSTCYKLFALWIIGSTTLTSGILERSKKFGFSISMLSFGHRPYGIWNSPTEGNFLLRKIQYSYTSLEIAKLLVQNKIANQSTLLKSIRQKSDEEKEAIKLLKNYWNQVETAEDLQTLLGIEGVASRLYFKHWYAGMNWKGRKPRTKIDAINAVLDMGYTYLFYFVESMLHLYGFDVYQGVYHRCFYQRKSLVCDLVEPFRCIIDKQVKNTYNLRQFQVSDFHLIKGRYVLDPDKTRDYMRWLVEAILFHKEAIFNYIQEYYRCFMRQRPIEQYPVFHIKEF